MTKMHCEYCQHEGLYPSEVGINGSGKLACLDTEACDRRDEAAHPYQEEDE